MLSADVRTSCQQILNTMLTSSVGLYFGPADDPLVDVGLPFLLLSSEFEAFFPFFLNIVDVGGFGLSLTSSATGDHKCKMTIRTTGEGSGATDLWSWSEAWEVGVALAGMCGGRGKEGVQTRLGEWVAFVWALACLIFCFAFVGWVRSREGEESRCGEGEGWGREDMEMKTGG